MTNWYSSVYKSLIITSVISFIIYFFSSGSISLGALISGYSTLIFGIIMILYTILFNLLQTNQNDDFQLLLSIITMTGPFLLIFASIILVSYLIITYKKRILLGHVPNSYNIFNNIIIVLVLLQVFLLYNVTTSSKFETTKKIPRLTTSILYLYGVITAISSITLFNILKNFSADGFINLFGKG
jgi:glucan phosphoethanolaminetransferase (alkaline phosphatase superfamily)